MEFAEELDVAGMQSLISQKIFDEQPRVRVGDYVGNVVGDVVVYYDSLLDYIDIVYGKHLFIYLPSTEIKVLFTQMRYAN